MIEILEDGRYAATVCAPVSPVSRSRTPRVLLLQPAARPVRGRREWAPPGGAPREVPACAADAERVRAGAEPDVRKVMVGPQRVPYWEAGPAYSPYAQGMFGGIGGIATGLFLGTALGGMFNGGGYGDYEAGYDAGMADGGDGGGDGGDGGGDFNMGDSGGGDSGGWDFGGGATSAAEISAAATSDLKPRAPVTRRSPGLSLHRPRPTSRSAVQGLQGDGKDGARARAQDHIDRRRPEVRRSHHDPCLDCRTTHPDGVAAVHPAGQRPGIRPPVDRDSCPRQQRRLAGAGPAGHVPESRAQFAGARAVSVTSTEGPAYGVSSRTDSADR